MIKNCYKKYNEIWDKIKNLSKNEFDKKPLQINILGIESIII